MKCVTNKFQNSTNQPSTNPPIYEKDRTNLSEYQFQQREINSSIEFIPFVSAKLDVYNLHKSVASSIRCVSVNKSTDKHSSTKEVYYKLTPDFLVRLIRSVEQRYPRINSSLPESDIAYRLIGELSDKCLLMYGIGAIAEALDRADHLIKSGKRLPPLPEPERSPFDRESVVPDVVSGELPVSQSQSSHAKEKQDTQTGKSKARSSARKRETTNSDDGSSLFG